MCRYAFIMRSTILVGGFLDRENRNLEGIYLVIRVATIIFSFALTCRVSLLNWDM